MWLAALFLAALPSRQVTLDAVGDVMLARWVGRRIEKEGFKAAFSGVTSEFHWADMVVGNLECALTTAPFALSKPILLRASPAMLPTLQDAGFSALSLANNHAGDCGPAGVAEAQQLLVAGGITPVGPSSEPIVLIRNGIKIGLIGLMDLPSSPLDRKAAWRTTLKALRSQADVVVAYLHWGIEGSTHECEAQRSLARVLAHLDVDLVLGCHPHVLQPITWLAGPRGRRCLVAYSLGNFLFDARPGLERKSMILSVRLGPKGVEGYRVIPVTIDRGFPVLLRQSHRSLSSGRVK